MTKPDNTRFLEQANAQRRQATLAALLDLGRFLEQHTEPALLLWFAPGSLEASISANCL
jgi:hypothetical protein